MAESPQQPVPPRGPPAPPVTPPPPPPRIAPPDAVQFIPGVRLDESAMRVKYARSSGPGGQNVNKVNTKAELWVPLDALYGLTGRATERLKQMAGKRLTAAGEIHIASDTHRTQEANRDAVFQRLRDLLAQAVHEPKPRRKTKPSRAAKRRRLESKKHRGAIKAGRRGGAAHE